MEFEWDERKAVSNLRKHEVTFDEASSVFYDPLAITGVDPDHSEGETRMITFGLSSVGRLLVVAHTECGEGEFMKKAKTVADELRTEYKRSDFGKLERGKYYKRVMASSNVVVLDADVAAVFPNSASVNKALHTLVEVAQKASGVTRRSAGRGKRRGTG
jgi:uncharacterized DUF497 family protein